MPRPVEAGHRYVAGLDGIRAIAVLAVIAYHLNVGWAKGGLLGVGVFFTLSGYLITDLLLSHWDRYGNLGLGMFWLRRARRLLPALFVMLIVVSIWVALFDAAQISQVRREVVSAALYFANWSTIASHGSYFARFQAPLPLDHLWSLSIEEQFYLVWPWLLLILLHLVRSRRGAGAARADRGGGLGLSDGPAVPPRRRPHARVRGHRHPRVRAADRRCAGDGLAHPDVAVGPAPVGPQPRGPGRRRDDRGDRDPAAGVADELAELVPVPHRDDPAVARHRRGDGRGRQPVEHARRGAGLPPDAVDRRPLVRDLPLALADHRPVGLAAHRSELASGDPPVGRHVHRGGAVVAVRRGADPPGGVGASAARVRAHGSR